MANKTSLVKIGAVTLVAALIGAYAGGYVHPSPKVEVTAPSVNVTQLSEVAQNAALNAVKPFAEELNSLSNVTKLTNDKVFEADAWEAEAEVLATEEFEDNDYKDVFKFIDSEFGDIKEKEDIVYVKVRDVSFDDMDNDDKNGVVTQELKVKYENVDGDDVVKYLIVTTEIDDGEVESQEFEVD
jgi:hypothetical protein